MSHFDPKFERLMCPTTFVSHYITINGTPLCQRHLYLFKRRFYCQYVSGNSAKKAAAILRKTFVQKGAVKVVRGVCPHYAKERS